MPCCDDEVRALAVRRRYPGTIDVVKSFGDRLQLVGFFPTALAVALVAIMIEVGAPAKALTLPNLDAATSGLGSSGAVVIIFAALAISVTLQPLQFRLIQWLEGYWSLHDAWYLGPVRWAFRFGVRRQRRRLDRAHEAMTGADLSGDDSFDLMRAQAAEETLRLRLPSEPRLLPTALGNVLRATEDRAAVRYGIDSVTVWPRLFPLLPPEFAAGVEDEVTQLDVSVRLVLTWLVCGFSGVIILASDPAKTASHPAWLVLVGVMFGLAHLSYRAAIESALAGGRDIEVAFDLYRSLVLEATRLPAPRRLSQERQAFSLLQELFESYEPDRPAELSFRRNRP